MIIRIIATALIPCAVRTQAGWMTRGVVWTARWSVAARRDMAVPSFEVDARIYAGNCCFVTAIQTIRSMPAGHGGHKKASRVAPARLSRIPLGTRSGHAGCYDAGIRLSLIHISEPTR